MYTLLKRPLRLLILNAIKMPNTECLKKNYSASKSRGRLTAIFISEICLHQIDTIYHKEIIFNQFKVRFITLL